MEGSPASGRDPSRCGIALVYGQHLHVGGVERHLLDLVEQGAGKFSWTLVGSWTDDFAREAMGRGCRMVGWQGPRRRSDMQAAVHLAGVLRGSDIRIVHQHGPWWSGTVGWAVQRAGCSLIRTVHLPIWSLFRGNPAVRSLKLRVYRLLRRSLLHRRGTRWVFVAESVRRRYVDLGLVQEEATRTIPNGVPVGSSRALADRRRARADFGLDDGSVAVIFTGRLDSQKGLDVLIEAISMRRDQVARAKFLLAGDGPAGPVLRDRTRNSGLDASVTFLGELADVSPLLAAGDVFVLPSRFEALSYSLLEALSAGLPAIVTDVGDHGRVVAGLGSGIVVPEGDAAALASALVTMVHDENFRFQCGQGAGNLGKPYTLGAFWRRHKELYEETGITGR